VYTELPGVFIPRVLHNIQEVIVLFIHLTHHVWSLGGIASTLRDIWSICSGCCRVGGSSAGGEVETLTQIHVPPVASFTWKRINCRRKIKTFWDLYGIRSPVCERKNSVLGCVVFTYCVRFGRRGKQKCTGVEVKLHTRTQAHTRIIKVDSSWRWAVSQTGLVIPGESSVPRGFWCLLSGDVDTFELFVAVHTLHF
jgi:hypothetical protein